MQNILPSRMLQTIRLWGEQWDGVCSIRVMSLQICQDSSPGVWKGCRTQSESRKCLTSSPRDLPLRRQMYCRQLVRATRRPVLTLTPSQDPPASMSLPAQMLGSSSKGPRGSVLRFEFQSRLNANIKLSGYSGVSRKNVMHIFADSYYENTFAIQSQPNKNQSKQRFARIHGQCE